VDITLSKIVVKIEPDMKIQNSTQAPRLLFRIPQIKISSGEKVLIKGQSGKGKTTFLHLLAGLFLPNEGSVKLGDYELTKMSEDERAIFRRRHIGMVFQKLNLIDHLTALENTELSLAKDQKNETAMKALQDVGLGGRENARTSVLSLGEQQRIAIARVLSSSKHSLVFADEPTSSLDEKNAFEVTELLVRACEGKTLIVVSHDHRIEKYFSRIVDFGDLIQ
jgi:putative ABC transport system ATP-binding protein